MALPPPPYEDQFSLAVPDLQNKDASDPLSPLSPAYSTPPGSPSSPSISPIVSRPPHVRSDSTNSSTSSSSASFANRRPPPQPLSLGRAVTWSTTTSPTEIDPLTAVPSLPRTAMNFGQSTSPTGRSVNFASAGVLPPPSTSPSPSSITRNQFTHHNVNFSGNPSAPGTLSASTPLTPGLAMGGFSSSVRGDSAIEVPAHPPIRSPLVAQSPCLVHSHLDSSLSEFIAKKDEACAMKKRRKEARAARRETGDEESDTASDGAITNGDDEDEEDDDEQPSLTRQLAETAVSVREMSKQLGRARVISHTQSILIITKARDNHLIRLTRELALWIMQTPRNGRDRGLVVYVDSQLKQSKRFDAEGMEREHPELFRPLPRRYSRTSSATSFAATPATGPEAYKRSMTPLTSLGDALKRATEPDLVKKDDEGQLRYWTNEMCAKSPHLFDFVVTLGGDGTVLYCSWLFQHVVPPVIPFALGSLGFLTGFDFSKYAQTLNNAIDNGIRVNLRMRFTCTVYRAIEGEENKKRRAVRSGKTGGIFMNSLTKDGWEAIESGVTPGVRDKGKKDKEIKCFSTRPVESFEVLNDLVVDRGPSPYVSLLELFGDEHHMTTVQADGLTVSTPTGSTAYSLSAGGSLVHPEIPAIMITPICPHTLSFRPMLLPDSMELRICVPYNSRSTAWASFDGRGRVELRQGDHIKVTASRYPFPTVCADNQSTDWFNSIARTLKWNERQRQKSFVILEEGRKKPKSRETSTSGGVLEPERVQPETAAQKAYQEFGDEEDEEEDSEEDDIEEEEESYDIDDLSSNPATSTSSPAVVGSDPSVGHIPPLTTRFPASAFAATASSSSSTSPPSTARDRFGDFTSASSSVDLTDSVDRFGMPPPRPPKLSARHSHNDASTVYDRTPLSAPPNINSHGLSAATKWRRERGEEGDRDHIREPMGARRAGRRKAPASRSRSRDRRSQVVAMDGDETTEPGRAFAVFGADSDSSLSGSETNGE